MHACMRAYTHAPKAVGMTFDLCKWSHMFIILQLVSSSSTVDGTADRYNINKETREIHNVFSLNITTY